jgi:hypothetical protein
MRFRRDRTAQHEDPTGRAQLSHLAHRSDCPHRASSRQAGDSDPPTLAAKRNLRSRA